MGTRAEQLLMVAMHDKLVYQVIFSILSGEKSIPDNFKMIAGDAF